MCISLPSIREYSGALKWYKPAWLGFLDSVANILTGNEPQSQICQPTPLNSFLCLTGTRKMGSNHCTSNGSVMYKLIHAFPPGVFTMEIQRLAKAL